MCDGLFSCFLFPSTRTVDGRRSYSAAYFGNSAAGILKNVPFSSDSDL